MPSNKSLCRLAALSSKLLISLSACLLVCMSPCLSRSRADDVIDSPMYKDPDLPVSKMVMVFRGEALDLWLEALKRPDADTRCRAVDAIAVAKRRGVKELGNAVAPLRAALDQPDQFPAVRLAIAKTLIELDAKETAASLFEQSRAGNSDLRELIEPALARWDYQPARALWLERLNAPSVLHRNLVLAIRGLGAVREEQATERLRELVLAQHTPASIRVEAARALGLLRDAGLEKDAERLAADAQPRALVARLAAAWLLRRHKSPAAIEILQRLVKDPEPAVAAIAVGWLFDLDVDLLVPAVQYLVAASDPTLRSFGVDVLFQRPTAKHLSLLADRLDDYHMHVREKTRGRLHELATNKALREAVIAEASRVLGARQWRGLEQATVLLAQLDHKPAAPRFVTLLSFDRPEVYVAAAWGLRKLAVKETLPDVAKHVDKTWKQFAGRWDPMRIRVDWVEHQLSQLNQFMGQQKYRPADALLRQFIPKRMDGLLGEARAAAVWSLGLIHEGEGDAGLATALEARLLDTAGPPPEDARVRRMSALTLGRLHAKSALPTFRKFCPTLVLGQDPIYNSCVWAINQITGEPIIPPPTGQMVRRDWFLIPEQ
jgi:HEAT repeat protein